jgi:hypothetical protein
MFSKSDNLKDDYIKAFKVVVQEFKTLMGLTELTEKEQISFHTLEKIIQALNKAKDAKTQ